MGQKPISFRGIMRKPWHHRPHRNKGLNAGVQTLRQKKLKEKNAPKSHDKKLCEKEPLHYVFTILPSKPHCARTTQRQHSGFVALQVYRPKRINQ